MSDDDCTCEEHDTCDACIDSGRFDRGEDGTDPRPECGWEGRNMFGTAYACTLAPDHSTGDASHEHREDGVVYRLT